MHARSIVVLALFLLFAAGPALAQKPDRDPRPLARPTAPDRPDPLSDERVRARLVSPAGPTLSERIRRLGVAASRPSPGPGRLTTTGAFRSVTVPARKRTSALALQRLQIERRPNGTVGWMSGPFGDGPAAGKQAPTTAFTASARSVLAAQASVLRLDDPDAELRSSRTERDRLGYVHARFEQMYEGVPVWGRDLIAHFDPAGKLYLINGTYEPTPRGVRTTPSISAAAARRAAVGAVEADGRWAPLDARTAAWLGVEEPAPRVVVYPDEETGPRLAYEVVLQANLLERYRVLVDAHAGRVLHRLAEHCTLDPFLKPSRPAAVRLAAPPAPAPARRAQFVDAQGVDLAGVTQSFRVHQDDAGTHYLFSDLDNIGTFALPNLPENGGAVTLDAGNNPLNQQTQLSFVTDANNTWNDPASVSAHRNQRITYDYFKTVHGRKAINDADQSLVSIVHVTEDNGQSMENAFFVSRFMAYGDGGQVFKPLAGALDVAAHEMSHGVIFATAGLLYQNQSGALNESFADVFGVMVDREDFLLGEDVMNDGHAALRDLLNPNSPQARDGDPAVKGSFVQPAHMNDFKNLPNDANNDNGGVHINSGIPNRAAALIIQALGRDRTEQIYYRALTRYLTRNSQFGDARNAVVQAAGDLFPGDQAVADAVAAAFDAVGIGAGTNTNDPDGNDIPRVTGGSRNLIVFVMPDGDLDGFPNGSIVFVDLETFLDAVEGNEFFGAWDARVRVDRAGEDLDFDGQPDQIINVSQLSATVDGSQLWYVNNDGQVAVVDLAQADASTPGALESTAQVLSAPDFFLEQPGDVWNGAVGPVGITDEGQVVEWLALVSAYDNDPTLYLTGDLDPANTVPIALTPETTQQGIVNDLIQFPDVASWSPNPNQPRIAFDALQAAPVGSNGLTQAADYWGIFEIDFNASSIYNLIPSQPASVSVGNITYSNTDPDVLAFNVIEDGVFDIYLANFEQGALQPLGLPEVLLGQDELGTDVFLQDAERPVFSPDDGTLAFTSRVLSTVVFLQGEQIFWRWTLNGQPHNPHWFVLNGNTTDIIATDTEDDARSAPRSTRFAGSYPNPFRGTATLRFDLDAPAPVRLEVFDVLGRSVARLVDEERAGGRHEVRFDAAGLPAGTYVARLRVGDRVDVRKLVLMR